MRPVRFRGVTAVLGQPEDWDEAEYGKCVGLPVMNTLGCVVSCWKPTWKDLLTLLLGGGVYLWVVGDSQPPAALSVQAITKE